ncbi:hypothetical protein Tco_0974097 [Tanacetum coccineum]|uniref:DUF4283 domain-containing protein n=1 Tax=Tanacetum coccineum TaxID=301880 RepID=A0ABQ5EAL9_9ASTR
MGLYTCLAYQGVFLPTMSTNGPTMFSIKQSSLKKFWSSLKVGSPLFKVDERMVWVEINGLSLCVWEFNAFKKVTVNVVIHGETFEVHVKEIGTRSIHITGDLVSNDLGDRCDVEECRSLNDEVDPNDILDDFIQHVLEEKELSNVPKDVQHVEKRVNDEHVARRNKMENKDVDSDVTIPPGFENLFNVDKHGSRSSTLLRTCKISTSFGTYKWRDMKGFSFINEINMMIEVGGALGYDVKGCKRSLRRMINGIGVSKVDK